jgi:hypothetical protein
MSCAGQALLGKPATFMKSFVTLPAPSTLMVAGVELVANRVKSRAHRQ